MDQPASISSIPRTQTIDNPGSSLKEPALQETAIWIDHYLRACGIEDHLRRRGLRDRILADVSDAALSQKLNSGDIAELQRRIDRLLLGNSGPAPNGSYGIGRLLSDEKDRGMIPRDASGIAMPRITPAPMPAQVVHDDHSPLVSARRLAAGLTGIVALVFGGR